MEKKYSSISKGSEEDLYLIKFCLNNNGSIIEFYTLMAYGGEEDRPIMVNEKIIFFKDFLLAQKALENSSGDLIPLGPSPEDIALACDIPKIFKILEFEDSDEACIVLNCLNTFFDLLAALKEPIPDSYKNILYKFADHLTFRPKFSDFIKKSCIERYILKEAFNWCVKAIFSKSVFLCKDGWVQSLSEIN